MYKIMDIKKFEQRADYRQVIALRADFSNEIKHIVANEIDLEMQ